ncbi:hypothetical protein EVG20_g11203, partial [Dentipellis fragilis]
LQSSYVPCFYFLAFSVAVLRTVSSDSASLCTSLLLLGASVILMSGSAKVPCTNHESGGCKSGGKEANKICRYQLCQLCCVSRSKVAYDAGAAGEKKCRVSKHNYVHSIAITCPSSSSPLPSLAQLPSSATHTAPPSTQPSTQPPPPDKPSKRAPSYAVPAPMLWQAAPEASITSSVGRSHAAVAAAERKQAIQKSLMSKKPRVTVSVWTQEEVEPLHFCLQETFPSLTLSKDAGFMTLISGALPDVGSGQDSPAATAFLEVFDPDNLRWTLVDIASPLNVGVGRPDLLIRTLPEGVGSHRRLSNSGCSGLAESVHRLYGATLMDNGSFSRARKRSTSPTFSHPEKRARIASAPVSSLPRTPTSARLHMRRSSSPHPMSSPGPYEQVGDRAYFRARPSRTSSASLWPVTQSLDVHSLADSTLWTAECGPTINEEEEGGEDVEDVGGDQSNEEMQPLVAVTFPSKYPFHVILGGHKKVTKLVQSKLYSRKDAVPQVFPQVSFVEATWSDISRNLRRASDKDLENWESKSISAGASSKAFTYGKFRSVFKRISTWRDRLPWESAMRGGGTNSVGNSSLPLAILDDPLPPQPPFDNPPPQPSLSVFTTHAGRSLQMEPASTLHLPVAAGPSLINSWTSPADFLSSLPSTSSTPSSHSPPTPQAAQPQLDFNQEDLDDLLAWAKENPVPLRVEDLQVEEEAASESHSALCPSPPLTDRDADYETEAES